MSFHKVTEFGLAGCEEGEADIVHISNYKELQTRIAQLEQDKAVLIQQHDMWKEQWQEQLNCITEFEDLINRIIDAESADERLIPPLFYSILNRAKQLKGDDQ